MSRSLARQALGGPDDTARCQAAAHSSDEASQIPLRQNRDGASGSRCCKPENSRQANAIILGVRAFANAK